MFLSTAEAFLNCCGSRIKDEVGNLEFHVRKALSMKPQKSRQSWDSSPLSVDLGVFWRV